MPRRHMKPHNKEWSIEEQEQKGKPTYVVYDPAGTPRRSFVPVDRLYDYARGVFDAQE